MKRNRIFYGWVNLGIFWLAYLFITVPFTYAFGIIVSDMSNSIGLTMTLAAGGYTCYQLCNALISPIAGKLIVKLGPKKVLLLGCVAMIAGALMMAFFVHNAIVYYFVWIVLFSIGMRCGGLIAMQTILSNWFFHKRSLAMSLLLTAGGIGGYIFAPVMNRINTALSWNAVWVTIAVLCGITFLLVIFFLRERPEEMNQQIDNGVAAPVKTGSKKQAKTYKTTEVWTLQETIRKPAFYYLIIAFFTASFLMASVGNYAVNHLTLLKIDSAKAAAAVGYFALINTAGRMLVGTLDGRVSMKYVTLFAATVAAVGEVLMVRAGSFGIALVALICIGIGYGVLMVASQTLLLDYFGTSHYSEINGVFGMVAGILSSLPTVIIGFLFDLSGNYSSAWLLGLGFCALTFVCMLISRPPRHAVQK